MPARTEAYIDGDALEARIRCSRCRKHLPPSHFRLDSDGYVRSWCNECGKAAKQEWRARNRDRLNARRREQWAAKTPARNAETPRKTAKAARQIGRCSES